MEDSAIVVQNVSKDFRLPHERTRTIKAAFTGVFRKRGKKDTMQHALKDISFDIKKGEFFGIVGRNGSGKSTLLKILAGIYQPTKGKVAVRGKLVPFIELGVGFNPELTGRENVYLNGAMLGFSKKEVESMYDEIVEFAELGDFMDQRLKNYSSGMQVRLAFSMAIRAKAEILLVDEVLAVGDADFQRKCFDYFRELKRSEVTVVFVSHDMEAIREYCDEAILIENNKMVLSGSAAAVAKEYTKLFMNDDGSVRKGPSDGKRWGNGSITTTDISIDIGDDLVITQKITAEKALDGPIVGFRLKDASGKGVTGTNTKVEKYRLRDLAAGESMTIVWSVPNILSDGIYTVDPAILQSDGITVADWWDDALKFRIKKLRHLPYPVDPDIKVRIDES